MNENATRYETPCADCGTTVSSPKTIVNHKGETINQPRPETVYCVRCGNNRAITRHIRYQLDALRNGPAAPGVNAMIKDLEARLAQVTR